jgi:hypothetical protein
LFLTYNYFYNESISFHPGIFVKSDLIQTQIDFSARVDYNGNIFGGVSLRGYGKNSFDAAVLFAGMKLNDNLSVAYAYDIGLSALNQIHRGSHEIVLNFNLNKVIGDGLLPKIIYNPRFL